MASNEHSGILVITSQADADAAFGLGSELALEVGARLVAHAHVRRCDECGRDTYDLTQSRCTPCRTTGVDVEEMSGDELWPLLELRHWLPTREYGVVAQFVREGGEVPPNLTIRLSAHWNDRLPELPAELAGFPISTTHTSEPPRSERPTVVCRAATRENRCGGCRACWSRVARVSYPLH
jgi:hypothetical protein